MGQTITVKLPTLHPDQIRAYKKLRENRFLALRCGRRWGKTLLGETLSANAAVKRETIGWFAPEYKFLSEPYQSLRNILVPVTHTAQKGQIIRTTTGGQIDFWSLDNEIAGRGRRYHKVIIDEAAFAKENMTDMWRRNIRPTLVDFRGSALVMSNTNGLNKEQLFWQLCNEKDKHGFAEYHARSSDNPYLSREELAEIRKGAHPLVWKQEYLAEFVDWSGDAFFEKDKLLFDGLPVPFPTNCDAIYAVIDTAVKTGKENDGTAVVFWSYTNLFGVIPLIILDWDIVQIEGALLEHWLPNVFRLGEDYARQCKARRGFLGAWIEDKNSGSILLQQAQRRTDEHGNAWQAFAIESGLTSLGKDERAIDVSGYVYRGMVKISQHAFLKTSLYKEHERNHLLDQVLGFRIGSKEPQDDDLLDCFAYGISLGLGNAEGF
jgi:hypothetical protein